MDDDYDELRKKNIAERNAVFAEFFKELETEKIVQNEKDPTVEKDGGYLSDGNIENEPPKKRRRVSYKKSPNFRVKNVRIEVKKKYNTRSRAAKAMVEGDSGDSESKGTERLVPKGKAFKVMFPWAKPFEREMEMMSMDSWDVDKDLAEGKDYGTDEEDIDESEYYRRKRVVIKVNKGVYDPDSIPSPDEITPAMLKNVAQRSSGKTYCKIKGSSCHQCRQKTMDTKTVCRSGECIGVRGQFCGPCLRGRYGEDAATVLKDPNWACPPCRGLCNCSICRTRNGQRPTGILAPVAQEEGYQSVMDYLQATSGDDETAVDEI